MMQIDVRLDRTFINEILLLETIHVYESALWIW